MNLSEIKALIAAMADSGLAEMTFSESSWTLRLVRDATPPEAQPQRRVTPIDAPTADPDAPAANLDIEAPLGGIVHLSPTPGAPPFIEVGQAVRAGDAVCIIEAMKVFNTIRADRDGVVAAILVPSGIEVDAGQALLRFV